MKGFDVFDLLQHVLIITIVGLVVTVLLSIVMSIEESPPTTQDVITVIQPLEKVDLRTKGLVR